jgi:heme-degrading monooxygenase HmoA
MGTRARDICRESRGPQSLAGGCRCEALVVVARLATWPWRPRRVRDCRQRPGPRRPRLRGGLTAHGHPHPQPERHTVILEIADIRIHPGQNAAFEAAIQHALATVASQAQGFKGAKVNRGIESPERYVLQIFWATLEDHTVAFRQGPLFAQWRAIIGPFFAAPPVVEHFELVSKP